MIKIGDKYKHYKGTLYEVIAIAKHSETLEELVVYRQISDHSKVWARPLSMFEESIIVDDNKIKRFEKLE